MRGEPIAQQSIRGIAERYDSRVPPTVVIVSGSRMPSSIIIEQ